MSLHCFRLRLCRPIRFGLAAVALFLILYLTLAAAPAQAQSMPEGDEAGCGCHSEETETWQASPHGQVAAEFPGADAPTCEGCHGPYVRGHPEAGMMELTMNSDMCTDCHADTYAQWQDTQHAQAGVQCIGCHLSHSQSLRLTGAELCASCHQHSPSDSFHLSHKYSDVACTSCHVSPESASGQEFAQIGNSVRMTAPTHDFTDVSAANCIDCHSAQIEDPTVLGERGQALTELLTVANRVPELSDKLKVAEEQNSVLASTTFVSLGLGMGVGGVLGIILVLFVGYVMQRRSK